MGEFYVYIMASGRNGTLYVGIARELGRRVASQKEGRGGRFTSQYGVAKLVYYEKHESRKAAAAREKQLKKWNRRWKIRIIEKMNPGWKDLLTGSPTPAC